MRGALLLAVLALAPVAAAQAEPVRVTLSFADEVVVARPLEAAAVAPFHGELHCLPLPPGATAAIHLWLVEAPPWATVAISPVTIGVDTARCGTAPVPFEGVLTIQTSAAAPAREPTPIRIMAAAEGFHVNASASAETRVEASFFSILDVALAETIKTVAPGDTATFRVTLTNFGNDDVTVRFDLTEVAPGLDVVLPTPATIASKQRGADDNARDVEIVVKGREGVGYLNEVGVVTFTLTTTQATTGAPGEERSASLLVTTKGVDTPGAPLALMAGALAVAAAARRR